MTAGPDGTPERSSDVSPGTTAGRHDRAGTALVPAAHATNTTVGLASTSRQRRLGIAGLVGVTFLPLVVAAVRVVLDLGRPWHPLGDLAIIELTTRDLGHHPVLLGPYSRFGWHHPGPAMFLLLAAPYRLVGGSAGLLLGALLVNLAASAGIVVAILRQGGERALRWALPVLGLLFAALGAERLRDPWNPSLPIIGLALFVLAAWCVAGGARWWLPVAFALGSVVVQTHVGYGLTVVAVLAVAVVPAVRARGWRAFRRPALTGAAAAAALWSMPLWEQGTRDPGNATLLVRYLRAQEPSWTALDGLRVAVTRFGALPAQVVGASSLPDPRTLGGATPWWGMATLAALAAATVVARRRRLGGPLRLAVLTWVVLATSAVTAARVQGPLDDWLVAWMAVGSFLAWLVIGWVLLDRVPATDRMARATAGALAVLTVVVAVGGVRAAVARPGPGRNTNETAAALFAEVDAELDVGGRPVLVTFGPSGRRGPSSVGWGAGLVLHLERRGEPPVTVDPRWRNQFGERLTRSAGPGAVVLTVTTDPHHREAGTTVIADVDGVRVFLHR